MLTLSDADDGPSLPTKNNEEFKPFMRRLPEFKFWFVFLNSLLFTFYTQYGYQAFTNLYFVLDIIYQWI